jgi:hypothetical protein
MAATKGLAGKSLSVEQQRFALQRMPQTDEELWWWVLMTWGVRIPRQRVCPGHCAPFEAFADAFFARSSVAIWKASRGFGGKTQLLSLLGMSELVALGAFVTILGGSGAQSQRVHETMTETWHFKNAPSYLLLKDPTKFDTFLTNGGKARTLMASTKSVRGPHPQRMRLDEIDEMEMNVLTSAQGQPMRKRNKAGELLETNTVMSSTHQYPDGTMTQILRRAKEEGWPVYHWCFRESMNKTDGWLLEDEVNRKRSEIPAAMWSAEYELQEPSFEGRAIDEASVDAMFDKSLGEAEGAEGKYIEIEAPRHDRDYVTGADWAKSRDNTVITTWDATEDVWRLVAFERIARRPWPVMIKRLNMRWKKYGGKVAHDETGLGSVVHDLIEIPRGHEQRDLVGITIGGRLRTEMITEYVNAIENGKLKAPRIASMYDEHRFATPDDLYNGTATSHLPDSICASALAYTLRSKWQRTTAEVDTLSRDSSPWTLQETGNSGLWTPNHFGFEPGNQLT